MQGNDFARALIDRTKSIEGRAVIYYHPLPHRTQKTPDKEAFNNA
jgi:hypothetical protein